MAVSSMTGFARMEGRIDGLAWVWELRSVNGKSLDLRFRLPTGFDALEAPLKTRLGEALKRGSISATLTIAEETKAANLRVNEAVLAQVIELMRGLESRIDAAPPRLDGLLAIRGVIEVSEERPDDYPVLEPTAPVVDVQCLSSCWTNNGSKPSSIRWVT